MSPHLSERVRHLNGWEGVVVAASASGFREVAWDIQTAPEGVQMPPALIHIAALETVQSVVDRYQDNSQFRSTFDQDMIESGASINSLEGLSEALAEFSSRTIVLDSIPVPSPVFVGAGVKQRRRLAADDSGAIVIMDSRILSRNPRKFPDDWNTPISTLYTSPPKKGSDDD